jgi:glycolate oxidase iron-sulfur subunit
MGPPAAGPLRRSEPAAETAVLFTGCVQRGLFGHVHDATDRACAANGITLRRTADQVCCGALAAHAGDEDSARELARQNVAAFNGGETIIVNSAGCGAMLRSNGTLLGDEPARRFAARVRDVSEVLAERGPRRGSRSLPLRVAWDAPCHLLHAQRVTHPPLELLAAIPGIELVPLEGSDRCCGGAGLYALAEPAMSAAVLERKLDAIHRAGPAVIATANPGCIMQIGAGVVLAGMRTVVCHPIELLALSYDD